MPSLRAICLTAILCLPGLNAAFAQSSDLCDRIDEEGVLKLKPKEWALTEQICECSGISTLSMKKSQLLKLPECFDRIQGLRSIDLSKSALTTFPMALTQMYELEHISIANTGINYLPDEIADLPNLQTLDLRGTGIEALPHGLDHLKTIDMRLIMLSKLEQDKLRERFPNVQIFFSSPCHCH